MNDALKIDAKDNVAVVIRDIQAGDHLTYIEADGSETQVHAITSIPIYHKIALSDISEGDKIVKYGEHIGEASCSIQKGEHVHTHNVASVREDLHTV